MPHSIQRMQRPRVIALHCSGAGAYQWRNLSDALADDFDVFAPEHFGSGSRGPWTDKHTFSLSDEAAATVTLIDDSSHKAHIVGHSYGGGGALNAALIRPCRIASMVLYEPSAFHLLRKMGARGAESYAEIAGLAEHINRGIMTGEYCDAIATFVDYWNGASAWNGVRPNAQDALLRWLPKAPLDFQALMNDPTAPSAYRALRCPTLIICGEHTGLPSRIVAEYLSELLPNCRLEVLVGAGHMGPLTHAIQVNALIARHIIKSEIACRFARQTRKTCHSESELKEGEKQIAQRR
jgi:pimeloyl-ACP methyl ester carboxylesterase